MTRLKKKYSQPKAVANGTTSSSFQVPTELPEASASASAPIHHGMPNTSPPPYNHSQDFHHDNRLADPRSCGDGEISNLYPDNAAHGANLPTYDEAEGDSVLPEYESRPNVGIVPLGSIAVPSRSSSTNFRCPREAVCSAWAGFKPTPRSSERNEVREMEEGRSGSQLPRIPPLSASGSSARHTTSPASASARSSPASPPTARQSALGASAATSTVRTDPTATATASNPTRARSSEVVSALLFLAIVFAVVALVGCALNAYTSSTTED